MKFRNLEFDTFKDLQDIIRKNISKQIIPGNDYIPVTGKVLDEEDILSGVDAMLDGWLTTGRYAQEFEREFARYFGSRFSVLVNSGSSANLTAFMHLLHLNWVKEHCN